MVDGPTTFVLVYGGGHGGWCSFAGRLPGVQFAEVAAGHELMITRPAETAEALLAVS